MYGDVCPQETPRGRPCRDSRELPRQGPRRGSDKRVCSPESAPCWQAGRVLGRGRWARVLAGSQAASRPQIPGVCSGRRSLWRWPRSLGEAQSQAGPRHRSGAVEVKGGPRRLPSLGLSGSVSHMLTKPRETWPLLLSPTRLELNDACRAEVQPHTQDKPEGLVLQHVAA